MCDNLTQLGESFWEWRLETSFRTSDDIPRVDHSANWLPSFSSASIAAKRDALAAFESRWRALDVTSESTATQVDYRLLGSAMHRVHWELDILRNWEKDAVFLVGQILGPWFDLLQPVPPFSIANQRSLLHVLRSIPNQIRIAQDNLSRSGVAPLARVAAELLSEIDEQLSTSVHELEDFLEADTYREMLEVLPAAVESLTGFSQWLVSALPGMKEGEAVGRDQFIWYLRSVALIAQDPEELVRAAEQDFRRAVISERLTKNRNRHLPKPEIFESAEQQVVKQRSQELEVRAFYEANDLLSQPETLKNYYIDVMPSYIDPVKWLGVTDDLTYDTRLDLNGVSYCPPPTPDLPYFYIANAQDPRLGIVHEGAHYKQLALSWRHPRHLRRRYYDSVANEGIAFYNEEMMLLAGLFSDAPHSEEVVHNFNRLRSLRVIVDVNLATGAYSLDDGVSSFMKLVPMDRETALEETAMYVATPGLAMSYHVGKTLLMRMMTDALIQEGDDFSIRNFHDYVWLNGNVPYSLQRWELLGDRSEVDALDSWASDHDGSI